MEHPFFPWIRTHYSLRIILVLCLFGGLTESVKLTISFIRSPGTSSVVPSRIRVPECLQDTVTFIIVGRTAWVPVCIVRLLVTLLPPICALKWQRIIVLFLFFSCIKQFKHSPLMVTLYVTHIVSQ